MRVCLAFVFLLGGSGCARRAECCRTCANESYAAVSLAGTRAAAAFEPQFGGVYRDAGAETRMARIGALLVEYNPRLERAYCYRLLGAAAINAASLPPGRIYVTRGLYAQLADDGLLAAVLAHEMAHLEAGDSFKPRCTTLAQSLARECAADARAAEILGGARMDANRVVDVLDLIADVQPLGWVEARRGYVEAYGRENAMKVESRR